MTADMDFDEWLTTTRNLQIQSFGTDPWKLEGEDRTNYVMWNVTAATDELHELLGETGWKPWATDRYFHRNEVINEAVDALHFIANILVTAGCTGQELSDRYRAKQLKNAQRQADGYDGVTGKCPGCKRDMTELPKGHSQYKRIAGRQPVIACEILPEDHPLAGRVVA